MRKVLFPIITFAILMVVALSNPDAIRAAEEQPCNGKKCRLNSIYECVPQTGDGEYEFPRHCTPSLLGLSCTDPGCT